jgi:uncharacterized protein YegP (UPF0339 family)
VTTTIRVICLAALLVAPPWAAATRAEEPEARKLKFEVYPDKAGKHRWRLKAANGETLATGGQGYQAKADAKRGVQSVQKSGTDARMTYEFYEDAKGEQRWRLKASNGQVVASSSQGYRARADCEKAALVKAGAAGAEVVDAKE